MQMRDSLCTEVVGIAGRLHCSSASSDTSSHHSSSHLFLCPMGFLVWISIYQTCMFLRPFQGLFTLLGTHFSCWHINYFLSFLKSVFRYNFVCRICFNCLQKIKLPTSCFYQICFQNACFRVFFTL